MNLERVNTEFTQIVNALQVIGFPKDDNTIVSRVEIRIYARLLTYSGDLIIINSRIVDEIKEIERYNKYMENRPDFEDENFDSQVHQFLENSMKLSIDVQDFYFYTRRFLDSLNLVLKHFFINMGNPYKMTDHSSDLLNKEKMDGYKKEIDNNFFEGLEKHTFLIADIRKPRDGLMHRNDYIGFTSTKKGTLGFELLDISKTSWGSETVKDLSEEIQKTIDNLSALVDYICKSIQLFGTEILTRYPLP